MLRLEALQQGQRPLVVGARAHVAVQVGHGFDVVVEHVRRRLRQDLQRAFHAALAAEIRGEDFDADVGRRLARLADAVDEVLGTAVAQVVAIDAGDDHVLQAHVGDGACQALGFARIRRLGPAMGDVAETAAARAHVAQDHEGGGAVAEALVDVRAAGVLAHGDQAVLAQLGLEVGHRVARTESAPGSRTACATPAPRRTATGERAILSPATWRAPGSSGRRGHGGIRDDCQGNAAGRAAHGRIIAQMRRSGGRTAAVGQGRRRACRSQAEPARPGAAAAPA